MPRYVALLRAVNVGGRTIKMDRLRATFEALPFKNVETFIASGNVLFDTTARDIAALERKIEKHLEAKLGMQVGTYLRALDDLPAIAANHPFGDAKSRGHTLSVGFFREPLSAELSRRVKEMRTDYDDLHVYAREVYWYCRGNMSDSVLWKGPLAKLLGADNTFRNVTTIQRLAAKIPAG
ncbi:MAG: hypothetical protein JWL61_4890 [Gemmatimonadetes bacterium]|jgi:uncharacterized protein (DUF1697 family)|nr:hypothetical protein [Gemmatimonadota bacterium]